MIEEVSLSLMTGIVAGLIATFLTVFFRNFWAKSVIPWYEERIYKDAHIEGRWIEKIIHSDEDIDDFIFNIERKSHQVFGEMIHKKTGKKYIIQGEFRNMILTLTYSSTILYAVDRGCFSFLLIENGRQLNGHGAFYYSPEHRIKTAAFKLSRADT